MPARTRSTMRIAFEFGDRADDDDDGPAQRAAGVDLFPEADELDSDPVEFVEYIQEVLHRPGDSVASPDQNNIEPAAAGIGHHLIQARSFGFCAGDPVCVLLDDLVATLSSHLSQVEKLRLRVLIDCGDPQIERGALHARLPFLGATSLFLSTYFWIHSRIRSVISRPCAAVADLKLR